MKHNFFFRQIGIFIGCFIGHLIVDNTFRDCVINILAVNYIYSIFYAIKNKK